MTGVADYEADLRSAGFVDLHMTDMTGSWAAFCQGRAAAFTRGRDREVRVHGAVIAERLEGFFSTVARLFASGSLGGVRIVATRR
jgi:hypothetical protein